MLGAIFAVGTIRMPQLRSQLTAHAQWHADGDGLLRLRIPECLLLRRLDLTSKSVLLWMLLREQAAKSIMSVMLSKSRPSTVPGEW